MAAERTKICVGQGRGLLFPLSDEEQNLPNGVRGVMYAVMMIYCFLGVAIVADIFVASIEAITSSLCRIKKKDGRECTANRWNHTVANLSLMALGSSAPEICLSFVELLTHDMHVGELGPSTIVGSASFNLFVIVGVCIFAIPHGETRSIDELPAFYVTAVFSVFSYAWLVFILVVWTPHVVDIWEACLTFLFFPILLLVSYKVDLHGFSGIYILQKAFELIYGSDASLSKKRRSYKGLDVEKVEGMISFAENVHHLQADSKTRICEVVVLRRGECHGDVQCNYRTQRISAVPGYDFVDSEGTLEFSDGVSSEKIFLELLPLSTYKVARDFVLILEEPTNGAFFDPNADGGPSSTICTIKLLTPGFGSKANGRLSCAQRLDSIFNIDELRLGVQHWSNQIDDLRYCLGSAEAQQSATKTDWLFHIVCFPWKVLFVLVPPTTFVRGWVTFNFCLLFIFLITAVLADLAELFGCVLGVPGIVTALTFVALGTSMPDLFASLSAAGEDPTADACVVNVTGSNSVNVFLGLGMPWTIASIYWYSVGRTPEWEARYPAQAASMSGAAFVVESKNLGFCVFAFTCCCVVALGILLMRRTVLGAELGGPFLSKLASCCCLINLWLAYVALCSWRVLRCAGAANGNWCKAAVVEQVLTLVGFFLVVILGVVFVVVIHRVEARTRNNSESVGEEGDTENGLSTVEASGFEDLPVALKDSHVPEATGSTHEGQLRDTAANPAPLIVTPQSSLGAAASAPTPDGETFVDIAMEQTPTVSSIQVSLVKPSSWARSYTHTLSMARSNSGKLLLKGGGLARTISGRAA